MSDNPLQSLDEWEEDLKARYPVAGESMFTDKDKPKDAFRNYTADVRPGVKEFYRVNHIGQTLDFVMAKKAEYLGLNRMEMGIWEAMEYLNQLVDDSDPDTDLSQIQHLLQTSERIREEGHPRWFILTGLIHDLGKILCLWGEPQWAVVGDTFAVGCKHSERVVFSEFLALNADHDDPVYSTELGVYERGCGFENVHLSWGHDEYIYHVAKDYLPQESLAMLRYHSFYPWHREGAYRQFENDHDRAMLPWVLKFNEFDLYSKSDTKPDVDALRPYYEELIAEFFPAKIRW